MRSLLGMCFDWRVLTGLAAVGVGIWLIAPQLVAPALPILVVLICPLSMLLMARMMATSTARNGQAISPTERLAALEREQARLDAEIARARVKLAPSSGREVAHHEAAGRTRTELTPSRPEQVEG
ncbi:MAG: DUF2933 domain-containing protein [Chloroflexi bacterium]|nr:MAG: DUF2933 domain-containing protein [Chloroflexota bacterium]